MAQSDHVNRPSRKSSAPTAARRRSRSVAEAEAVRLAQWDRIKAAGPFAYIFTRGPIFGALMVAVRYFTTRNPPPWPSLLLFGLLTGVIWAIWMWFSFTRRYTRAKSAV